MGGTPPPTSYVILENKALKPHLAHISAGFALNGLTGKILNKKDLTKRSRTFILVEICWRTNYSSRVKHQVRTKHELKQLCAAARPVLNLGL